MGKLSCNCITGLPCKVRFDYSADSVLHIYLCVLCLTTVTRVCFRSHSPSCTRTAKIHSLLSWSTRLWGRQTHWHRPQTKARPSLSCVHMDLLVFTQTCVLSSQMCLVFTYLSCVHTDLSWFTQTCSAFTQTNHMFTQTYHMLTQTYHMFTQTYHMLTQTYHMFTQTYSC